MSVRTADVIVLGAGMAGASLAAGELVIVIGRRAASQREGELIRHEPLRWVCA